MVTRKKYELLKLIAIKYGYLICEENEIPEGYEQVEFSLKEIKEFYKSLSIQEKDVSCTKYSGEIIYTDNANNNKPFYLTANDLCKYFNNK